MNDHEQPEQQEKLALRRRTLLRAAIGTGVAVAAHSAPKISAVPAYALTTSSKKDGKCYAFGWSSNNPEGKGWMKLSDQKFDNYPGGPILGPTAKSPNPSDHSGAAVFLVGESCAGGILTGPVTYTWAIPAFGSVAAFNLAITLSGCMNNNGASLSVSGLPTDYCLKWYNSGRGSTNDPKTCGQSTDLVASGLGTVTMSTRTTGFISDLGGSDCCAGLMGKVYWHFDVAPCP